MESSINLSNEVVNIEIITEEIEDKITNNSISVEDDNYIDWFNENEYSQDQGINEIITPEKDQSDDKATLLCNNIKTKTIYIGNEIIEVKDSITVVPKNIVKMLEKYGFREINV
jgi:hypothetical protein